MPKVDRDPQLVLGVVEHDRVQLASVAIEIRGIYSILGCLLVDNDLAGVILVDIEPIRSEVDAQGAHATCNVASGPSMKDTATVGAKGNDISELLELLERFIYLDIMALTMTLYSRTETTEPCVWRGTLVMTILPTCTLFKTHQLQQQGP